MPIFSTDNVTDDLRQDVVEQSSKDDQQQIRAVSTAGR